MGGLNEEMMISQDVDLVLRLIEVCRVITHVPEVLYSGGPTRGASATCSKTRSYR